MKLIKRWTAGLVSRVDYMVTQVENQEALVNSAIQEARQAAARAKVLLGRVRQDGIKLRDRLAEEREAESRWRDRARKCADEDESRAIECLRRSKRAGQMAAQLQKRLDEHERVEQQLAKDIRIMNERISELMEKRNLMRTRQSRAEAMSTAAGPPGPIVEDLDDIFERWEIRVTEKEISGDCGLAGDALEEAFLATEEEQDLRSELQELKQSSE